MLESTRNFKTWPLAVLTFSLLALASSPVRVANAFPWMQSLRDTYEREGLSVIAINLDRNRPDAERFLAQFRPNFEVRFDPQGQLAKRFKVQGMPSSLIIDRHGVQRYSHIGFQTVDRATYETQLRELLAEK